MHLEKWYADLVVDGQVTILYRANLRLGPFQLGYQCHLPRNGPNCCRIRLGKTNLPILADSQVKWPAEAMAPNPVWHGASSRPSELWRCGDQRVMWDPIVLNGEVNGEGICRSARGYVERLTMNFQPWRLGLKLLRWGRFCGNRHSLVWIQWEGKFTNKLALLDGLPTPLLAATRDSISTDCGLLTINGQREIVSESMGSGALKSLGVIKKFAPRQFLSGIETKWIALGVLSFDAFEDEGVVIHEEVVWK